MSEDFLNMIMKSKTSSIDEKIKKLSMVLDKIMSISVKSIDGVKKQIQYFESLIYGLENQVTNLENKINAIEVKPIPQIDKSEIRSHEIKPQTPSYVSNQKVISTPKPKPKPVTANINPRAALQSELKQLFSKMKK